MSTATRLGGFALAAVVALAGAYGVGRLHPVMSPDGTWRSSVTLAEAGTYRAFADFAPGTHAALTLGTYGHLVVLRAGDLGYVHIHPVGTPGDGTTPAGPGITFDAEVATAGGYRLFLDFQHAGRVHTAAFTEEVA